MGPLVSEYRKPEYFSQEMLSDKEAQRVAHKKIKEVFQKMLPLKTAILKMVTEHLPSPITAQQTKIDTLSIEFKKKTPLYLPVRQAITETSSKEPVVVYVSKMQPFNSRLYDIATRSAQRSESTQRLVAVSRVYSGTLRVGAKVFVFGANHSE